MSPTLDLDNSVTDLAHALVDLPSVSGEEVALADAVEEALRLRPHLQVIRTGNTVAARTRLARDRRVICAGHLDTVPIKDNVPGWIANGNEGFDSLWGRGSVDMKSGVAVFLSLAAELEHPKYDVTWIFYDCEEIEAERSGLARLAREHPEWMTGDFAVLGEPTAGRIEGGCNGTIRAEITTRGRAAHSARAWRGVNAIHAAAPVLDRLARYQPETVTVDGLEYREGLNAVGIRGGIAGNVIPDQCVVTVNYRFAPDKSVAQAAGVLSALFEGFEVEITDQAAGARPGLDAPLAADFASCVRKHGGGEPGPKYGWTDVSRFSQLGVPAVNCGPGDASLAHADDEHCPLNQIQQVRRALGDWLA